MWQRFSERTRRIVFYAQEAAVTCGMKGVSSEHLLIGLLQDIKKDLSVWPPPPTDQPFSQDLAGTILLKEGVDLEKLWIEAEKQMMAANTPAVKNVSLTPSAMRVIDSMYEEARGVSCGDLTTEFLLLALIRDQKGSAGQTLQGFGIQLEAVRQQVAAFYVSDQLDSVKNPTFWDRFFRKKNSRR